MRKGLIIEVVTVVAIGVALAVISIACFPSWWEFQGEYVTFPGETMEVSPPSNGAFVGGEVHANGNGKFVITSSTDPNIAIGSEWDAHGLDNGSIPNNISRRQGEMYSAGDLEAKITIPELAVTQPTKVTGYLKIEALSASSYDKYSFTTGEGEIESDNFHLMVYPLESQQITKNKVILARIGVAIGIVDMLYLLGTFPFIVHIVLSIKEKNHK